MMRERDWLVVALLSGAVFFSACSSNSGPNETGTGGKVGSGGKGGSTSSGGAGGKGGSPAANGGAGGAATGGATGGGQGGGAAGSSAQGGAAGGSNQGGSDGLAGAGGRGTAGAGTGGSAGAGTAGAGGVAGAGAVGGAGTGGVGGAAGAGATGGRGAGGRAGAGGVSGAGGAGAAGGAGGSSGAAGAGGGVVVDPVVARGEYLVRNVLGCSGCHTPQGGAFLSGTDCFVKSGTSCLSSGNLTNDDTGLKMLTDAQIKDAFTKGVDPDDSTKFLFATMPYYQFKNLTDGDANAVVAFLRTVPGVSRTPQANTAPYDVQPAAAEWQAVAPADLPASSGAAGPTNGKYLATLVCATCHTVEVNAASPRRIDATKAFQGGKVVSATVNGTAKMVQTSNLTPDATGLMTWNTTQIAAAITTAKDKNGTAICGMRALPNMTPSDASDIGTYLLSIPAVANTITMTCQ
jgi:hypothetical protein